MSMYYYSYPSCGEERTSSEQPTGTEKNGKNDEPSQAQLKGPAVLYQDGRSQIFDHDNTLMLTLDLPGVQSNDLNLDVENGILSIQAVRKNGSDKPTKFSEQFYVNEETVDTSKLEANLSHGVLTVTIPKRKEAKPQAIPVAATNPPEETDDGKELRFTYDLPGVEASSIQLEFHKQTITLHAERQRGHFKSSIDKMFYTNGSKVDAGSLKAYLKDGVLTITGVRKDAPKKKITVTSGNNSMSSELEAEKKEEKANVVVETVDEEKENEEAEDFVEV